MVYPKTVLIDSIEWNYLVSCLKAFQFGPDFIRWVKTLYKNIQSCVINNGLTTDYFALERAVRQGDPLSPNLFVVVVETLAIGIGENTAINGITVGKEETKLLQYADDTTAVLSDMDSTRALFTLLDVFGENTAINGITVGKEETKLLQYADDTTAVLSDMDSTRALFTLLDVFKELSGLRINSSKTEGMWVGSSRSNKLKPFYIKWPDDMKLLHEKNFIQKLESDKKLINIWSSRGLSLYGKVTIIKSLLIPKFVYILSLFPAPKGIVQELNRMLFKFLWKGTDKVTRLSTINDYGNGGLKMIGLESMIKSLRLAWWKRIFGRNDGAWKSYLRVSLQRFGGLFLFYGNYDIKDHSIPSLFYSELLQWWSEFRDGFHPGKEWQFKL